MKNVSISSTLSTLGTVPWKECSGREPAVTAPDHSPLTTQLCSASVSVHLTWLFTIGLEPMKPRNLLFQHLAYAHVMPACHLSPSADFGNFYPGKLFPITFRITWGMKFSVFKYAFLPVGGETQSISQEAADSHQKSPHWLKNVVSLCALCGSPSQAGSLNKQASSWYQNICVNGMNHNLLLLKLFHGIVVEVVFAQALGIISVEMKLSLYVIRVIFEEEIFL